MNQATRFQVQSAVIAYHAMTKANTKIVMPVAYGDAVRRTPPLTFLFPLNQE